MVTIVEMEEIITDLDKRLERLVKNEVSPTSPIYLKTITKLVDQMTKLKIISEMEAVK